MLILEIAAGIVLAVLILRWVPALIVIAAEVVPILIVILVAAVLLIAGMIFLASLTAAEIAPSFFVLVLLFLVAFSLESPRKPGVSEDLFEEDVNKMVFTAKRWRALYARLRGRGSEAK